MQPKQHGQPKIKRICGGGGEEANNKIAAHAIPCPVSRCQMPRSLGTGTDAPTRATLGLFLVGARFRAKPWAAVALQAGSWPVGQEPPRMASWRDKFKFGGLAPGGKWGGTAKLRSARQLLGYLWIGATSRPAQA